jgi:hypothetical protein
MSCQHSAVSSQPGVGTDGDIEGELVAEREPIYNGLPGDRGVPSLMADG